MTEILKNPTMEHIIIYLFVLIVLDKVIQEI